MKLFIAATAGCVALLALGAHAQPLPLPACKASADAMPAPLAEQARALTPTAIEWAEQRSREILAVGRAPDPQVAALARKVGVREPGRIRIVVVDRIDLPEEPLLRAAGAKVGLSETADGMTLGYAVIVRRGHEGNPRLLSHELRHVAQYEACGGIAAFLSTHLAHLVTHGYDASPFELDAERHERRAF